MKWQDRIIFDPEIQGGHAIVKGTRVPVVVLLGGLAGGDTIEEICANYLLADEDVRAALAFAADLVAEKRVNAVPG